MLSTDPRFARLQLVRRVRGRPEPVELLPGPPRAAAGLTAQDSVFGPGIMPYRALNLLPLAERGVLGGGVRIALLDTGFDTANPAFANTTVVAQRDFVFDDSIVRDEPQDQPGAHSHGTEVWSLLAAEVPGQLLGVAREASYLLAKTEDVRSETRAEEDYYVAALEWADSIGTDIVSSSIGYLSFDDEFAYEPADLNGDVAVTTIAADAAAARGILVVTSAGNLGPAPGSLVTPADGDSVVAVGATDSLDVVATFSSRGPSADGRLKPDLTAPGVAVYVLAGTDQFGRSSGTSFAAPLIAGAAVLLKQVHPGRGPIDLRRSLQLHGSRHTSPDFDGGFGTPDVAAATAFPEALQVLTPVASPLVSITPTFAWQAPGVPAIAGPVSYRLVLARDSTFSAPFVDTALADETFRLDRPFRPGEAFWWSVTAESPLGVSLEAGPPLALTTPAWATLTSLNDPAGTTVRERRPLLTWTAPDADPPIGPFRFDVEIRAARTGETVAAGRQLTEFAYRPPTSLDVNTPYRWRVIARLGQDSAITESVSEFVVVDTLVPPATVLFPNFPNPFPGPVNSADGTCIWFDLDVAGPVQLDVLDLRGHLVRRLVPGTGFPAVLEAGRYGRPADGTPGNCDPRLVWDARTDRGELVPPGVYVYRLRTRSRVLTRRMVFKGY